RHVEISTRAVKGQPPGIAEAERPDLFPHVLPATEGVIGRDRVGISPIDVDPEDLAQEREWVLSIACWVVQPASVSTRQVKVPVEGAEGDLARVVTIERVRD